MNEEQVIHKLRYGLFHRAFATVLTPERVGELAKQWNVNVEVTAYKAEESNIKCLFEVKP